MSVHLCQLNQLYYSRDKRREEVIRDKMLIVYLLFSNVVFIHTFYWDRFSLISLLKKCRQFCFHLPSRGLSAQLRGMDNRTVQIEELIGSLWLREDIKESEFSC